MPYKVKKSKGKGYDIVAGNGHKVGHSQTKKKAQASARIRNGAHGKR